MVEGRRMKYDIHTDVKWKPLEVVDAGRLADECTSKWWNQTLCQVNDSVARLGVFEEGEFHWHKHDLEGRTVELSPRQGMVVPRGVLHRTRAPSRVVVLMIESASIVPTGDQE